MANFHAEIINLSVRDIKMIREFEIIDIRKRFCGLLKIYTIVVPEESVHDVAIMFQNNLSSKLGKEWYITFHNANHVKVVFRNGIFDLSAKGIELVQRKILDTINAEEKDKWDELIEYAKSIGVPDNQCDFLPEDFRKQEYC